MSDYLFRVVEQSMGIAASVQPLIAPMFAPPSISPFTSLEDMMQQSPAGALEEASGTSLAASQPAPEILSTLSPPTSIQADESQSLQDADTDRRGRLIALSGNPPTDTRDGSNAGLVADAINRPLRIEETLPQSQPKGARQSEQPAIQSVQDEPVISSQAPSISSTPREKMMDSDGTPTQQKSLITQPRMESEFYRPTHLSEELLKEEPPLTEERSRGVGLPRPLPTKDKELPLVEERSRGVGLPRPLPTKEEELPIAEERSRGVGLPRPQSSKYNTPTQVKQIGQLKQVERAGKSFAPSPSTRVAQVTPSLLPQQAPIAQSDRSIQEINATTKTSEAAISGDTTAPSKRLSRDSHPLDVLVQQQSVLYPTPLLPGEISQSEGQTGKESRRYAIEATGSERVADTGLNDGEETSFQQNARRQSLARDYDRNLAPEPGAEQRLLTEASRRNDSANEPVIRVSIGRVEVRATTSPPAPVTKRAAPAAPALSLSDYLQRRKGGNG
jgi:hypothetical protein